MENILEKINKAGLKLLSPLTLQETYETIIAEASKLLNASFGSLYLEENDILIEKAAYPAKATNVYKPRRHGFTYRAYLEKKPFIIHKRDIVKIHPELKNRHYGSAICIPLSSHNKSIGSLTLLSQKDQMFSYQELRLLKTFGSYASLAIRKAQLLEELKKALETRDLFISMAAHELRTPITTINGYVQLLERRLGEKNSTESRWIKELAWETQRLILLVNELLEINRIKQGQLNYIWKECSIKEIIKRAISNLAFTYPTRKIHLVDKTDNKPDIIIGDIDKLTQSLNNVLENAAKFSSSDTDISVLLTSKSNNLVITIKDKGRGIDEKDLPKVFDGFYRKAKETEEGMGLGLYLAKNIIKLHHGSIKIKSKLNKGTEVLIELPLVKTLGKQIELIS